MQSKNHPNRSNYRHFCQFIWVKHTIRISFLARDSITCMLHQSYKIKPFLQHPIRLSQRENADKIQNRFETFLFRTRLLPTSQEL